MSLDTHRLHKLNGKGFDKLYTVHSVKWRKMAEKSVETVRTRISEGEAVKAGDVVAAVEHGIRISKEFEKHLESKIDPAILAKVVRRIRCRADLSSRRNQRTET